MTYLKRVFLIGLVGFCSHASLAQEGDLAITGTVERDRQGYFVRADRDYKIAPFTVLLNADGSPSSYKAIAGSGTASVLAATPGDTGTGPIATKVILYAAD